MATEKQRPSGDSWEDLFKRAIGRTGKTVVPAAAPSRKNQKTKPLELKPEESKIEE